MTQVAETNTDSLRRSPAAIGRSALHSSSGVEYSPTEGRGGRMPGRVIARRLSLCALGAAVVVAALLCVRAYQRRVAVQGMFSEFERLEAKVVIAGYADSSRSPIKVPIIREILTHRSQVELFMYDPATAEQVLEKAEQYPDIQRIWVNMNVFDRAMGARIEERMPGMDVIFYTPGPGMK